VRILSKTEAREFMVNHHGLRQKYLKSENIEEELLKKLRMIQLDPLDQVGSNADLVAHARISGLTRGEIYSNLLPGKAFEHFGKERCLLPVTAFPYYKREFEDSYYWWKEALRQLSKFQ